MNTARLTTLAILFAAAVLLPGSASAQGERACTTQYEPVCGAQQVQCVKAPCFPVYKTYGNECMIAIEEGARFVHYGVCLPAETGPVKNLGPIPTIATSTPPIATFTPPESCRTWYDGCNSCARMSDGAAACTKRYCEKPQQGYCTTFDKGKPGSSTSGQDVPSSTSSTTPIEYQDDFKPFSFIKRFWIHFLSWLHI